MTVSARCAAPPLLLALLAAGACVAPEVEPATLVLRGGRIVTLDDARPEARALAIRGDRVVLAGSDDDVARLIGADTEVIELGGRLAVPGLTDGHAHLLKLGRMRINLDLSAAETWDQVVHQVARAAATTPPGRWIHGRGWHQDKWAVEPSPAVQGFPVHRGLSAVSPGNPVLLRHASGHGAMVNRVAMERLGIGDETPDPPGGVILRDREGRATGMMLETAEDAFRAAYLEDRARLGAEEAFALRRRELEVAVEECLRKGVTTVHQAGLPFDDIDLVRRVYDRGSPGVRLYVMIDGDDAPTSELLERYRRQGDPWLNVRAIKYYVDGALGARGAWLLEPYADLPDSVGQPAHTPDELERTARLALEHGYQLAVHAIGDRGNRETLDLYERLFEEPGSSGDRRWRIEHAQHLHDDDVARFAELGVIASIQSCHCTSDASWVPDRIGLQRARDGAYVWRKLLATGARLINGTDAPVEDIDPIANFHAAVTRRTADGTAFFPEQRMSREEALRSITTEAAYASFEEETKGRLAPGMLADVVVLSQDLLTVPEERILDTLVDLTIVGGNIRYRR